MAKDALDKIIQVEKNSKELIEKFQKEFDLKLQNAKTSAKNIIEKQREENKKYYNSKVDYYLSQSEKIKKEFEKNVSSQCCELDEKFNVNSQKAVDAVIHQLIQNVEV